MKSKHEQAQALFDALDQVDEGFLRQACGTDTPEKFRALGKAKPISGSKKERPVTFLQHWGAFAACLAVALALAASPWFFSRVLPALIDPTEPTQPPEPTTTHTVPSTEDTWPEFDTPDLYISNGTERVRASMTVGNWYMLRNGQWYVTYLDGMNANDLLEADRMPWLTTELYAILEFEIPPDSIEVRCWEIKTGEYLYDSYAENVEVTDGMIHLKTGSYAYEVDAKWSSYDTFSGSQSLTFAVTANHAQTGYEYASTSGKYLWPSMTYEWVEADTLTATAEASTFVCFTEYTALADHFVISQQTLLQFLQENGMEADGLTYYAVDYGDSFSRSDDKEAYIDWSAMETWQQVLVTLQTILGDYTDYGYVYAMANTIAAELGWQTDEFEPMEKAELDAFLLENPDAVHLLYPAFSSEYASEEIIRASKTLSCLLLAEIDWKAALQTDLHGQLWPYRYLIRDHAKEIGIAYERPISSFAYGSKHIPLRMYTGTEEHYVESGYEDSIAVFSHCFADYAAIYETAELLYCDAVVVNNEIVLWDWLSEPLTIYWLSEESAPFKSVKTVKYVRYNDSGIVYARSLQYYMFGMAKHIDQAVLGESRTQWQSQAFCELVRSRSWFAKYAYEVAFTQYEEEMQLFYTFTGRAYDPEGNDFYEVMDILCYINDAYDPSASQLAAASSVAGYLMRHYGEEQAFQFLLRPDTFQTETGMTWEELLVQWKQSIQEKYADIAWQPST